jgi:hypothetical protein
MFFFVTTAHDKEYRLCRRFPPVPIFDPNVTESYLYQSAWPETQKDYWCGEFKAPPTPVA